MDDTIGQDNTLVTVGENEASRITGFSVKTLQKRRWMRQPPIFLKLGRKVRYRVSDLQTFLDGCTVVPERG